MRATNVTLQVDKLELLKQSIPDQDASKESRSRVSVQVALLWSLLDYSSSTAPVSAAEASDSFAVELTTDTQFLSPLNIVQTPRAASTMEQSSNAIYNISSENLEDLVESSEAFTMDQMNLFDSTLLDGFHTNAFGDDLYTSFGQLR